LAEEKALKELLDSEESHTGEHWNVDDIRKIVTAKHLCSCRDPIVMGFKVITIMKTLRLSKAFIPVHLSHVPLVSLIASTVQIKRGVLE